MSRRICPEHIILAAQFLLTGTLILSFLAVLMLVTIGRASVPGDQVRILDTGLGVLGSLATMACGYWFARQRSAPADSADGGKNSGV